MMVALTDGQVPFSVLLNSEYSRILLTASPGSSFLSDLSLGKGKLALLRRITVPEVFLEPGAGSEELPSSQLYTP